MERVCIVGLEGCEAGCKVCCSYGVSGSWRACETNYGCLSSTNKQTNKNLRCGNRKGLLGRNDQTHHRMGPKTMESIPPSKRNTQADIQLRTRQTNHQQETDGCIQIKHNPEHQPSRMSSKSTAYVPPKTASTPTKANTQTCSYLDFNQFLIRRITRNICTILIQAFCVSVLRCSLYGQHMFRNECAGCAAIDDLLLEVVT